MIVSEFSTKNWVARYSASEFVTRDVFELNVNPDRTKGQSSENCRKGMYELVRLARRRCIFKRVWSVTRTDR